MNSWVGKNEQRHSRLREAQTGKHDGQTHPKIRCGYTKKCTRSSQAQEDNQVIWQRGDLQAWNRSFQCGPQRKPVLPAPWSWTSNLQDCEKINFCPVSHPACGICYGSPRNPIQTGWRIPELFTWGKKGDTASCVDKWLYLWKIHFIYHERQLKTLFYSY